MKHLLAALVTLLTILPREQDLVLGLDNSCPRRYLRRINGKCYYFSVKKLNWFGALNNCLRKGLTLADLSNARDFNGAIGFLTSLGNTEDFWFGGNDLYHEGRFQYISNGRLVRYYSNYSNVLPVEHSDCDDCLEVRIRASMNMVAADNCQEKQYFICSERYCQDAEEARKPKHHSHEHLHHFHHDIGESGDGEVGEEGGKNDMLPIASAETEKAGGDSEAAIGADDVPDKQGSRNDTKTDDQTTTTEGAEGTTTDATADGETTTGEGGAAADDGASPASDAPPADGASPASDAPPADGASPASDAPPADGASPASDAPPADGAKAETTTAAPGAAPAVDTTAAPPA